MSFHNGDEIPDGAKHEDDERRQNALGERGEAAVSAASPVHSRVRSVVATGLFVGLTTAFILAYALSASGKRQAPVRRPVAAAVESESAAPPLGIVAPAPVSQSAAPPVEHDESPSVVSSLAGSPPPLPSDLGVGSAAGLRVDTPGLASVSSNGPGGAQQPPVAQTPAPLTPTERALSSPVLIEPHTATTGPTMGGGAVESGDGSRAGFDTRRGPGGASGALAASLQPTTTPAVRARVLPTRRWLLPKGAFVDCTLETAIDSTLAGFTTCVTAVDILSADGTVVLLERGTKLVGEARADAKPGQSRVFVLWNEARTPTGVVAELGSPGTDSVGRTGVEGAVDTHFSERFGAAILISLIDGAVQAAVSRSQSGGAVVVNPQTSTAILTEILRQTIAIPPTINVPQGTRLQVLVARDVDFRDVYELQHAR